MFRCEAALDPLGHCAARIATSAFCGVWCVCGL